MSAATKAILGRGTTVSYSVEPTSDTPSYTYVALGKVVSVNPNITVGEVENITLDSTFDDYLPTNPAGESTMTIRHRPGDAGVQAIQGLVTTPAIVHLKVTSNDGSSIVFDGFFKGYSVVFENKTIVDAEVPFRMTTKPVFAQGT